MEETTKLCRDCRTDRIQDTDITLKAFKSPTHGKMICQDCMSRYSYDSKTKEWGRDTTGMRFDTTPENDKKRRPVCKCHNVRTIGNTTWINRRGLSTPLCPPCLKEEGC